jgi:4-amino-4-deoxy-L-arabinose transferase-like glycosyltransferase
MKANSFSTISTTVLIGILVVYGLLASLFAIRTPAWQTPDEPAHYNYAAQVARNGCCPVIQPGDWDSAYLEQLKAARFAPELLTNFDQIQYEDHQPPLYYLIQALVYRLSDGSLVIMRLVSAAFGLGIIACTWAVARRLMPGQPQIGLGAAALVAFLPQHLALLASVNNDSLAWLLVAVLIWLMVRYALWDSIPLWMLGVLMGIALLTKLSTIFMLGVIGLAILLRQFTPAGEGRPLRTRLIATVGDWTRFLLPALVLGGIWWGRNVVVYGFPDVFGLREHDRIVADQLRTATFIAENGLDGYWSHALRTTFTSFWGQFGWMGLPLWDWLYNLLLVVTVVMLVGLIGMSLMTLWRIRAGGGGAAPSNPARQTALAWLLLALCALLAALQYAYYNLEFLQLQARYMFTGIIPFGIGLALGMDTWRRWLLGRWGGSRWLTPLPFLLLALLDVYLIWRVIPVLLSP